ncbi:cuticle protein AM1239-like [Homarus americanus]|uniref:cuticle protein AM1239-like n=1 Tax=Homarus americanus TaxID=6706 RepID=UPI001C469327|nr:cuticle protein AM1239-like [Homarus americanus]
MKLVLLACLVALATAAPRPDKDAVILADQRQIGPDGSFIFNYETSNGIAEDRAGNPGVEGQINMQGTYSFTHPDGTVTVVNFVSDENGYRLI